MLVKITNRCGAGCSHCMEGSTPAGEHMTEATFLRSLDLTARVERLAWSGGCPPRILLSGGECTEHPSIEAFVGNVVARGLHPILITNGMWLADKDMRESLLRSEWSTLLVQVTHDTRFYPSAPPPRIDDTRVAYVDRVSIFVPLGRGKRMRTQGVPLRQGPSSFNFRSMTRHFGSVEKAVAMLRARTALGLAGHCTPSITHEGWVVAGETRNCFQIGTVESTNDELTAALLSMRECDRCGLEAGLAPEHRAAIGLSSNPDVASQ